MGIAVAYDEEYWREEFDHRAAILEYDGGVSRKSAENEARTWQAIEKLRVACEAKQRREQATKPAKAIERPTEQQATLPGFETAYQGG